ncbi:hypothetical protein HFC70_05445 [Agrobacterium sp. a22-2]|uniref:hypothetical protein n=1 Tax=Agrobacterium sp. a22-2 TaxID=2283840 RepID=UPI00144551B4|nr:hypothetical protein [Agrobacterium sp. a22-2]NKN35796.1 hypothetical protein [Agrobacterium sp. a22-2]
MSEAAPRPNVAAPRPNAVRAMLALALTDLLLYGVAEIYMNVVSISHGRGLGLDADWWLSLAILYPILLAPALIAGLIAHALLAGRLTRRGLYILEILVGGLASGGFLAWVSIVDTYFSPPGLEPLYAAIGFAAGALWGAIYVGLLLNRPAPSP